MVHEKNQNCVFVLHAAVLLRHYAHGRDERGQSTMPWKDDPITDAIRSAPDGKESALVIDESWMMQSLAAIISIKVGQRTIGKTVVRYAPVIGAIGVGG